MSALLHTLRIYKTTCGLHNLYGTWQVHREGGWWEEQATEDSGHQNFGTGSESRGVGAEKRRSLRVQRRGTEPSKSQLSTERKARQSTRSRPAHHAGRCELEPAPDRATAPSHGTISEDGENCPHLLPEKEVTCLHQEGRPDTPQGLSQTRCTPEMRETAFRPGAGSHWVRPPP